MSLSARSISFTSIAVLSQPPQRSFNPISRFHRISNHRFFYRLLLAFISPSCAFFYTHLPPNLLCDLEPSEHHCKQHRSHLDVRVLSVRRLFLFNLSKPNIRSQDIPPVSLLLHVALSLQLLCQSARRSQRDFITTACPYSSSVHHLKPSTRTSSKASTQRSAAPNHTNTFRFSISLNTLAQSDSSPLSVAFICPTYRLRLHPTHPLQLKLPL